MAGDWIKMRPSLVSDHRVVVMADHLAANEAFMLWLTDPVQQDCTHAYRYVTRDVTVALCVTGLMRVWGAVSETAVRRDDDAVMVNASIEALDYIGGCRGFGEAMECIGWVEVVEHVDGTTDLRFPNFLKDNTLKRERSEPAERQRRYRERQAQRGGTKTEDAGGALRNGDATRVTKRREEKTNTPPTPQGAKAGGGDVETRIQAIKRAWPFVTTPNARTIERLSLTAQQMNELAEGVAGLPPNFRDRAGWLLTRAKEYANDRRRPPPNGAGSGEHPGDRTTQAISGGAA